MGGSCEIETLIYLVRILGEIKVNEPTIAGKMYNDLPEELQERIMRYLQADEFIKAKKLMDEYSFSANQQVFDSIIA